MTRIGIPGDRDLAALLILGVPAAVVVALVFDIRGPQTEIMALTGYAGFLGAYLGWIFAYEYAVCWELHDLKSRPLDTLTVAAVFGSVLQLSRTAGVLSSTFLWFAVLAATLVCWELYTMLAGHRKYFLRAGVFSALGVADLAIHNETAATVLQRLSHWREYRYWVVLDGILFVFAVIGWTISGRIEAGIPLRYITVAIAAIGAAIGLVNVVRYCILTNRLREHVNL